MNKVTITKTIDISDTDIDDLLVNCLEGGSNFWVRKMKVKDNDYKGAEYGSHVVSKGGTILIQDDETGKWHPVTKQDILNGIERYSLQNKFIDFDQLDGPDSDAILQLAIFNEIIYG